MWISHAEVAEALQVRREGAERPRIVEFEIDVRLKADAVEGHSARAEILSHVVDCVRLGVERLGVVSLSKSLAFGSAACAHRKACSM